MTLLNTINASHRRVGTGHRRSCPQAIAAPSRRCQDYVAGATLNPKHRPNSENASDQSRSSSFRVARLLWPDGQRAEPALPARSCGCRSFAESRTHATKMAVTLGSRQPVEIVPKPLSRVGFARHPWLPQRRNGGAREPPRVGRQSFAGRRELGLNNRLTTATASDGRAAQHHGGRRRTAANRPNGPAC